MTGEQAESLRLNNNHWKLGVVYFCRQDPGFILCNRWKFGWAWNLANLKTFVVLPIFVLLFLSPFVMIAAGMQLGTAIIVIMLVAILLALVTIVSYVAPEPR